MRSSVANRLSRVPSGQVNQARPLFDSNEPYKSINTYGIAHSIPDLHQNQPINIGLQKS